MRFMYALTCAAAVIGVAFLLEAFAAAGQPGRFDGLTFAVATAQAALGWLGVWSAKQVVSGL